MNSIAERDSVSVRGGYRRGDLFEKRRKLMDAWAVYCGTVHEGGADKVVPIKGAS